MLKVKNDEYLGEYNIKLEFNNGKLGIVNLSETIFEDKRPVFARLKEISNFRQFTIEHHTVVWPNSDLDLAPEYLFFIAFRDEPELQEQFKKWGYII